ncbi:WD repeat, SAM and U-box domain-containing protein 1 [Aplochiton taeniatus]
MVSLLCTLQHHRDDVNWCAFSPALLATCSGDKTVRLYDTRDFSERPFSPLSGHGYGVHCCCFSSCGSYLVTCSTDASIIIWSTEAGKPLTKLEHPGRCPVRVCALGADSSLLLSGACDGTVALWDFHSKRLRRCRAVSEASVVACCSSPCGQMFVTGCSNGDVKLWDMDMELLHAQRHAHDLGVTCCHFAPQYKLDGDCVEFRLASCGQDSQLKIWIVSQHGGAGCEMLLLHTLTDQSAPVLSCAFSADGEMVMSGSVDKTVTVYDANQGVLLHTLNQHDRYVTAVALSPCMSFIATGSMDKTVKVWRIGEDGLGQYSLSFAEKEAELNPIRPFGRYQGNGLLLQSVSSFPAVVCSTGRKSLGHLKLLVSDWSEDDVGSWLCEKGLEELLGVFKANNIDGPELLQLSKETLASELGIESVGLRGRVLRKVEALNASLTGSDAPDEFLCPITQELMRDPVIAADGYSYEREAIESWISAKNRSSPMTNLPLQTTMVTPNRSLKMAIGRWKSSQ